MVFAGEELAEREVCLWFVLLVERFVCKNEDDVMNDDDGDDTGDVDMSDGDDDKGDDDDMKDDDDARNGRLLEGHLIFSDSS